jgi:hypothetical protein
MQELSLRQLVTAQVRAHSDAEVDQVVAAVLPLFPGIDKDEFTQRLKSHLKEEFDEIDRVDADREITNEEVLLLFLLVSP